ncbi:MAG: hypothetical protein HOV87_29405 [Catenulispora sp.]|nr:hypothetical protein [Catenulispora sp.]
MDGTRFVGPDHHKVDLYDAMQRGVTTFIPSAWQDHDPLSMDDDEASPKSDVPVGLLVYPDPAQAGLGIADDMTLSLGIDGGFRMFQLQAVPAPEHYTPSSAIGAKAIVTREFLVVAEVPAWWAFGPHGRHVNGLITAVANLGRQQVDQIGAGMERPDVIFEVDRREVLDAADLELMRHDRVGAARVARGYARAATYRAWDRDAGLSRAASLIGDLAHATVVGDVLSEDQLNLLLKKLTPHISEIMPAGEMEAYGAVAEEDIDADVDVEADVEADFEV